MLERAQELRRQGMSYRAIGRDLGICDTTVRRLIRTPTPGRDGQSYIYFVRGADLVKIGRAVDPVGRLGSLRCGSPVPLELVALQLGGAAEEAGLHRRFCHHRSHGEWFTWQGPVEEYVLGLPDLAPPDLATPDCAPGRVLGADGKTYPAQVAQTRHLQAGRSA